MKKNEHIVGKNRMPYTDNNHSHFSIQTTYGTGCVLMTDWSCCFNAWLTQAPLGRSSAGKQMLRSPMTTKTMADRSRGCIFQKPAQSCGPRCDKHSPLPCLWFIVHDCALHHTHKQTNTETTAFVSRACGVIICYITTSAWRAPLYFNGRAVNKCLATALMPITNC